MRGDRKGIEGKVSKIDRKKYRISIEGVTREKVDGTALPVLIHPSKVMIINLNLDDKWRRKILDRKQKKAEISEKQEGEEKAKKKKAKKSTTPKKVAEKKEQQEKKSVRRKTTKVEAENEETAGE
jgi:large subunit ribosomal protein L24